MSDAKVISFTSFTHRCVNPKCSTDIWRATKLALKCSDCKEVCEVWYTEDDDDSVIPGCSQLQLFEEVVLDAVTAFRYAQTGRRPCATPRDD